MNHPLLIIHLLSATIWVGGHLFIAIRILPEALQQKKVDRLLYFEKKYEFLGIPALLLLVITGIWMATLYGINVSDWFSFRSPIERVVSFKLLLLLCTITVAVRVKVFIIPDLAQKPHKLLEMAVYIIVVTLAGVAMLVLGSFVRFGGL